MHRSRRRRPVDLCTHDRHHRSRRLRQTPRSCSAKAHLRNYREGREDTRQYGRCMQPYRRDTCLGGICGGLLYTGGASGICSVQVAQCPSRSLLSRRRRHHQCLLL
ncbi:hypothetical protein FIBSPDRAFT_329445 [Athelia psychrophila]|uniref:Uncharacterized protein n=1 Tax=Athelia psychrophila TaxID=1759441 RepID=A0A167WKY9_9AGAM|nr:hypothetical protein FIBSPDRAFT_329445 [Fibularhizoctonia sp. CBS 109695]